MKKRFLRRRRGLQLTSLVLGSLLCASITSAEEQTASFTTQVSGTASDQEYIDAGVRQTDGTYRFAKDSKITYKNPSNATIGAVRPSEDLKIDASGHVLSILTNSNDRGNAAAIKNNDKSLDIKAKTLRLLTNENDKSYLDYAWGLLNKSGTVSISGMTEIEAIGYISARAVEAEAGTVSFEGLRTKVNDRGDDSMSLLTGTSGQIFVNVKNGTAGNHTVNLVGNIGAMGATVLPSAKARSTYGCKTVPYGATRSTVMLRIKATAALAKSTAMTLRAAFLPPCRAAATPLMRA